METTTAAAGTAPTNCRSGAPEQDPPWARPALLALLGATAALYLWNLTASGWANAYYSAAAQAGSESWAAFFYGASDAAGSITVDKPPAAVWVMALSVRLLGLSSFAILLPQVLMGVATVGVVHATVRRQFGAAAGLVAGAVVALTPVAALMFTFNNPDALLTLLMALAAWATMRATQLASWRWLALAGLLVGLGFLTKALQVLLVVPCLGLAYLVAAPTSLGRRVAHSLVALAAAVVAGGWWVAVVELVPASARPYVGGSQTNSFLELTLGYNGLGRLGGDETGSVGGGRGWGETGLLRMFSGTVGDQVSWLLPSALVLLVAGLVLRGRAPRTDLRRAAYLVWGGWLVVTALVFSLMAGIFHEYYTVALAPAVGALVAMGGRDAWDRRHERVGAVPLAVAAAAAGIWGFALLSGTTAYPDVLRVVVLGLGLAAAILLLLPRLDRRAAPAVLAAALVAALAGPTAYTLSTTATGHSGSIVLAGPTSGTAGAPPVGAPPVGTGTGRGPGPVGGAGGAGGAAGGLLEASTPATDVVAALGADAEQYTWVAAAVGSQSAAGLQLATELPVMAVGGFNGSDPSPTLEQFQAYVAQGAIHWFAAGRGLGATVGVAGAPGPRGAPASQMGGSHSSGEISTWVEESFTAVTLGGETFYDLTRPLSRS